MIYLILGAAENQPIQQIRYEDVLACTEHLTVTTTLENLHIVLLSLPYLPLVVKGYI